MKPKKIPDEPLIGHTPLGLQIIAETNHVLTNVTERLGYFYTYHLDGGEYSNPISCIFNPEHNGGLIHTTDTVWLLLFYKGYRVLAIKHWRYISGPHAVRLYYQSHQTRLLYWIATLQIDDVFFYNEELVKAAIKQAIINKEFYIAPNSRKDIVAK